MIRTGDWSVQELVKYLCSIQDTLTDLEFQRLKLTAAFPIEDPSPDVAPASADNIAKAKRFKASDLYEPVDILRSMGLPLLK